ncbi:ATP-binding cassette subfamily B protein [Paenibacillus forsythiae]|uniref:ATP-binding cassette subfamily B protein n=1 Tax=Paenibacillus forsythiae TaxID=365616 RepID=A0ABU3H6L3_9BACL|nr:ABC transporter ATP-binding protein [Paenibacillus forsythiae]MDT3426460.1 ATP-binding cassette subfamily B protein [Paenibacillus forsythiae]
MMGKQELKRLYAFMNMRLQLLAVFFILAGTGIGLLIPQVMAYIIDEVIGKQKYEKLSLVITGMVSLTLLLAITEFIQNYLISRLGEATAKEMRSAIHEKSMRIDAQSLNKVGTGNVLTIVNSDVAQINSLITSIASRVLVQVIQLIAILVLIFYLNPRLSLVSLVTLPIYFGAYFLIKKRLYAYATKRQLLNSEITTSFHEDLTGVATIQAFHAQQARQSKLDGLLSALFKNNLALSVANSFLGQAGSLVSGLGNVVVLWAGTRMVINHDIGLGDLIAITSYIGRIYGPILSIASMNQVIVQVSASTQRLFAFLDEPVYADQYVSSTAMEEPIHTISLNRITVLGNHGNEILKNVSLNLLTGKVIAIVGESGSGKSTIAHLIACLQNPDEGQVLFNGRPAMEYEMSSIRKQIGIVTQTPTLFKGSVLDNIQLGTEQPLAEDLSKALADSSSQFVYSLPNGVHTSMSEAGLNFSGGEKQRICLARSLFRDYPILILDESTSSVDASNKRQILNALLQRREIEQTIIMITHTLDDIEEADEIVLVRDGCIAAQGTLPEVIHELPQDSPSFSLRVHQMAGES